MKQRLMDLYFTEGADLSNAEVLVQAAADIGLDPAQVRADLAGSKDVTEVEQEVQTAKDAGIQGVPAFIFGSNFVVSGAQAPEYLAEAIKRTARAEATE
jgi:predicted DsbA family dithiol-disulfide isomerase